MHPNTSSTRKAADALGEASIFDDIDKKFKPSNDDPPPPSNASASSSSSDIKELINVFREAQKSNQQVLQQQMEKSNLIFERMSKCLEGLAERPNVNSASQPESETQQKYLDKIPDPIIKEMEKRGRKFKDTVAKYRRAVKQHKDAIADLETLQTTSLYPKGVKQFRSAATFEELDEWFLKAADEDQKFEVVIKKRSTHREAMEQIHHHAAEWTKSIEADALGIKVKNLEPAAHHEVLKKMATELLQESVEPDKAEAIGLPKPLKTPVNPRLMDDKIEQIYARAYDEINKKIEDEEKEIVEQQKKEKDVPKPPTDLFDAAVEVAVGDVLVKKGLVDPEMTDADAEAPETRPAVSFMEAILPKNGESPPEGVGHNGKKEKKEKKEQKEKKEKAQPKRQAKALSQGSQKYAERVQQEWYSGGEYGRYGGRRGRWPANKNQW